MNSNMLIEQQPVLEQIVVNRILDEYPDLSYLNQEYTDCTPEENEKYKKQDKRRLELYDAGYWCSIGVQTVAYLTITNNGMQFTNEMEHSVWGIESDDQQGIEIYQNEQIYDIISDCHDKKIRISPYLQVIINEEIKQI